MNKNTMFESAMTIFKKKMEDFFAETPIETLNPDSAERFARSLNAVLNDTGALVYSNYLQSFESSEQTLFVRGEKYTYKFDSPKTFMTLFGSMALTRRLYQNASDSATYVPLDVALGTENEYMTKEVREAVAFSCAHITPEETAQLLHKTANFHPHATQIKRVVDAIGTALQTHGDTIDTDIRDEQHVPQQTRVLAVSMDGANVLLREAGAGKRGRPNERPGNENKQSESTAYKNAMVGAISFYGTPVEGAKTPKRLQSSYVAHMPELYAPTFKAKLEAELGSIESHLPHETTKVLLCDGARNLWKYIKGSERYAKYEKLIDYWHTLDHLSQAGEALFGKGAKAGSAWYRKYADILLKHEDGALRVLRSMRYFEHKNKLTQQRTRDLEQQKTFFTRNHDKMKYAEFRKRKLPIGSGPVEAACKTLVKSRMCRSGMRWSRTGGQNILQLRTYVKSNRWESFWKLYNQAIAA